MTSTLILGSREQYETIVDDWLWPELSKWRWTFKVSDRRYHNHVYGRRCVWRNGRKVTLLLSHEVLRLVGIERPSEHHTADHINRNTLDDRMANLRWATKRQQNENRLLLPASRLSGEPAQSLPVQN
jgi:hypothetical protein